MNKNKIIEYIILPILIILGFGVRLYKINSPVADWHSWRQADTASVAKIYLQQGINLLYPRYHDISSIQTGLANPSGYRFVEFPFYNAIHALAAKYITQIPFDTWGRLISVIFSLGSAIFIYLIGKRTVNKFGGLLAAFFFLFIPYNIYYSRVILPEPLCVLSFLVGIYLFFKYSESDKPYWLYLSGVVFAVSVLIKPFVLVYLLPLAVMQSRKLSKKTIVQIGIFLAIVLVPFLLWRLWINQYPEGIPFMKWAFNGDVIRFRPAFWRWILGERIGYLILGIWGLIPLAFGLISKDAKNKFNLWFFGASCIYLIVIASANVRHDYYQVLIIPSLCLLLARGVIELWSSSAYNYWISKILVIVSVAMMIGMGAYQVKEYYKIDHPEIIAAGQALDKIAPKNALVIAPYDGDTAFLYQTGRSGWPAVDDSFDNLIMKGASYYVSVNLGDKDTQMLMKKYPVLVKTDQYIIIKLK
jgi:hypothetical protein